MKELHIFDTIHEDIRYIMSYNNSLEYRLKELNKYLLNFKDESNRGIIRTLLVCSKPFRKRDEIKTTYNYLCDELRKGSSSGRI